jgi:phage terminase large subunit
MHPTKRRWENKRNLPGIPNARRWKIVADSARPEIISYLAKRGFNIEPAAKGAGSVEEGVTFLQNYDICVHPRCVHVADELATYSYKVDKITNQVLPVLADTDNHTIDALRYSLEAVRKAGSGRMDFASAGSRVTVAARSNAANEEERMKNPVAPVERSASGGSGWGSTPGLREGLM